MTYDNSHGNQPSTPYASLLTSDPHLQRGFRRCHRHPENKTKKEANKETGKETEEGEARTEERSRQAKKLEIDIAQRQARIHTSLHK